MRVGEKVTPVMAAMSALATLACCLPVGAAALLGTAGLAAILAPFQGWLLGLAAVLLAVGTIQIWRSKRTCQRRSRVSLAILAGSALIVLTVLLFPQVIAGLVADWLS